MLDEIKAIKSTPKNLRSFGLILGSILIALALAAWWKGRVSYPYWLAAGIFFLAFGVLKPAVLKPVYMAWMSIAMVIGWVVTRVILIVLFYFILTPLGFVNRLTGKNILSPKSTERPSCWIPRTSKKTKIDYENQF